MKRSIVVSGTPASIVATLTGSTVILAAPGAGKSLLIKSFQLGAAGNTTNQIVGLRADSNGAQYFSWPCAAAAGAGVACVHELGDPWRLETNTSLCLNLATATSSGIYATVTYEVEQR